MIGYHFTNGALRDGSPIPPAGEWLRFDGPIVPCESGLHASASVLDAVQYAPGNTLHIVELLGKPLVEHGNPIDKCVGNRRRIFRSMDCKQLLRRFARKCATDVLHLWDAPQVVCDYLAIDDEQLRVAAWDAARAARAAWDAARAAAWEQRREYLAGMVREEFLKNGENHD